MLTTRRFWRHATGPGPGASLGQARPSLRKRVPSRERSRDDERGSVSAEFAVALPGVILVLLLVLSLGMAGAAQVSLEEGARAAARELARAESSQAAGQAARRTAGDEISVEVSAEGEYVRVTLAKPVRILGLVPLNHTHTAEAYARQEQHTATGGGP